MANFNDHEMEDSSYIALTDNAPKVDPDAKIQMSLDEIIHVYGQTPTSPRKYMKGAKKEPIRRIQNRPFKQAPGVKLLSSHGAGHFFVSKQSPLIRRNEMLRKRELERVARSEMNRALNAPLLQRKKELILAKYKIIKTHLGVERMLVPADDADKALVSVQRKLPLKQFTKNHPPPLVDVVKRNGKLALRKKMPNLPALIDTSSNVRSTLPPLIDEDLVMKNYPPPLVDISIPSGFMQNKTFNSLPPPLMETWPNRIHPPALRDAGNMVVVRMPSGLDYSRQPQAAYAPVRNEIPPLVEVPAYSVRSRASSIPQLIDFAEPIKVERNLASRLGPRVDSGPPPLIDLVHNQGEDVKPIFVTKNLSRKSSVLSLNDRFSSFQG